MIRITYRVPYEYKYQALYNLSLIDIDCYYIDEYIYCHFNSLRELIAASDIVVRVLSVESDNTFMEVSKRNLFNIGMKKLLSDNLINN